MGDHQLLHEKIFDRKAVVGVIGLGYVGLPLAVSFAEAGLLAVGFDIDKVKVDQLLAGNSYIDDVESDCINRLVSSGKLEVTSEARHLRECDAIFICVPTPFDKSKTPDLSYVYSAAETIAQILRRGVLVVLQSTTYPGTTNEVVKPILESGTGLKAGTDFFLAFSPERVDPGNKTWNVSNTPKVVGGLTSQCLEIAKTLLEVIVQDPGYVFPVSTLEAAEMAKILENTYRAVNIALVNELAILAHRMGIDIWEVIDAASSKPFGFQKFLPGIGPGGHCIPIDPHYLSWKAREFDFQTQFIEIAADVNAGMAAYVVQRAQDLLSSESKRALNGATVLCLGAAFKRGVSDTRHSRSIRVMELLSEKGALIHYSDPMVPTIEVNGRTMISLDLNSQDFNSFDMVIVLVDGEWPLDNVLSSTTLLFDAVNSSGGTMKGTHRL